MNDETKLSDIAIIGIACRFPGAENALQYWQNLCLGKESIRFFTEQELLEAGVDEKLLKDPHYIKASPVLKDVDLFDAEFFKYSPYEAEILDPQQRLFLQSAWQALENAGYSPREYEGNIGVFAGAGSIISSYLIEHIKQTPEIQGRIVSVQALGNDKDFLTTRVSYKLNLKGPSVDVQTAYSTGGVAIHLACQSLHLGECDLALAGSVNIRVPHISGYLWQQGHVYSSDGHCRPFDEEASGIVLGSGVGLVVLKPLKNALRDGDHIYAVIKGTAINNDGESKQSYTDSSQEGQSRCMQKAFNNAGVSPETISYLEAHGSGNAMGDFVEVSAFTQVFRQFTEKKHFCALGSVKANIGHLDIGCGIASLIKTALMLHYKKIPPQINFHKPNPKIDLEKSPFFINTSLREWEERNYPRRACINSLGIGGTNAFLILEEAPQLEIPVSASKRLFHLFTLSARTEKDLDALVEAYIEFLQENPSLNLEDIAFTANTGRYHFNHRLFIVASTTEELIQKLRKKEFDKKEITSKPSLEECIKQINAPQSAELIKNGVLPLLTDTSTATFESEDWKSLLNLIGQLYLMGTSINWFNLYKSNVRRKVVLPSYPFKGERYWIKSEAPTAVLPAKLEQTSVDTLINRLKQALPTERKKLIKEHLRQLIMNLLNLSSDQVLDKKGFMDLGMDSLLAEELYDKLHAEMGDQYKFPTTLAFDYPNLDSLTGYIKEACISGRGQRIHRS